MYKIIFIVIIVFSLAVGCAPTGKTAGGLKDSRPGNIRDILTKVTEKNLTRSGFFIRKGKIITMGETGRISLFFTMKYVTAGKYLISIRSKTGLEAFRVYLSKDTILVNDRMNRNVLYGSGIEFEKLTGLPLELLQISVGDIFLNKPLNSEDGNCRNNELKVSDYLLGLIIRSTIDCKKEKLKSIVVSAGETDKSITIDFLKFRNDSYSVPKKVEINDPLRKIKIILSIDKYITPWAGDLEFIPGAGYTIKPLI